MTNFDHIRRALRAWFLRHRRDLPWRRTKDPYRIWLSEVMLQQTQVATALPYYDAFIERFPDVESLAEASIDQVLAQWSGLGYYRRARQLHAAARHLVERRQPIPKDAVGLRELPGIGEYTAAAIASIAFGEPVAVVDGNVERVLCRFSADSGDPKRAAGRRRVREMATAWLDPDHPGDSNEAVMELGATVCRPKAPSCLVCPLEAWCLGKGSPEDYPPPRRRRATEKLDLSVALVQRQDRVLLVRRDADDELMPGMWELPHAPHQRSRQRQVEQWAERYGGRWSIEGPATHTVRHAITHRAITFHVRPATLSNEASLTVESRWVRRSETEQLAMSSAVAKILDRALGR